MDDGPASSGCGLLALGHRWRARCGWPRPHRASRRGPTGRPCSSTAAGEPRSQVTALAVQASLLAAGSLAARCRARAPDGAAARRGATSPSRAIGPSPRTRRTSRGRSGDSSTGTWRRASTASTASLARRARAAAGRRPPPCFGTIRPRRASGRRRAQRVRRSSGRRRALARPAAPWPTCEDDGRRRTIPATPASSSSSPVGGGGPVGPAAPAPASAQTRERGGGGPPGADAADHAGPRPPGGGRRVVVTGRAAGRAGGRHRARSRAA